MILSPGLSTTTGSKAGGRGINRYLSTVKAPEGAEAHWGGVKLSLSFSGSSLEVSDRGWR